MPQNQPATSSFNAIVANLREAPRIEALHPIAARFVYSIRLIALHERARRDPVPELAMRLGNVEVAAKSLTLAEAVTATWPENISISRFCCGCLSHDEATIAGLVSAVANHDQAGFGRAIEGFVRHDRQHRIWEAGLALVQAELRNC